MWQDIATAAKDGTTIWAVLYPDIYPRLSQDRDHKRWNGVSVPGRNSSLLNDGYDIGWNVVLPIAGGGFPDDWIAGWMPLPEYPAVLTDPCPKCGGESVQEFYKPHRRFFYFACRFTFNPDEIPGGVG